MSERVLLTGAAGFIGAHTIEHFLENTDWEIVALDSFAHKGRVERLDQVISDPERVQVVTHDLNDPLETDFGADYIINMASESHVDRSIEDPVPFVTNNVNCALTMLEYARRFPCEAFIQISTDEVYGPMYEEPHPEWDTGIPSNPYSASKAAQESLAIAYWRTYGIPIVITNTMNNFGEMQDVEKFIPMIMKKVLSQETVEVHGTEEDIGSRFYLHARNHADALQFILENLPPAQFPDSPVPDRYNVVGTRRVDNLEMAKRIASIIGNDLKYQLVDFHSTRPGHDPHYGLDGEKLMSLGWEPPVSFDASLAKTVNWTMKHPQWLK